MISPKQCSQCSIYPLAADCPALAAALFLHRLATFCCGIVLVLRPRQVPDQPVVPPSCATAPQSAAALPIAVFLT